MSKALHKLTVRFSVDTVKPIDPNNISHCMHAYNHPAVEIAPDPIQAPQADQEVLNGRKPWPAVTSAVVEKEPTICAICAVDFKTRSGLQTHLSDHKHLIGKLDKYKKVPIYECKHCGAELNCTTVLRHRCFSKHSNEILEIENQMDAVGSPLACIFCRGRILPSRAHLIVHIVSAHSPHRNPLKCVFCKLQFRSDKLLMEEAHVFTHHVPEIAFIERLAYFKEVKTPAGLVVDSKHPFLCLYDPGRLEGNSWVDSIVPRMNDPWRLNQRSIVGDVIVKPKSSEVCGMTFKTLAEYTAHIFCCHAILPHARDKGKDLNVSQLRALDALEQWLPGPTIRELINASMLGQFAKTQSRSGDKSEFSLENERRSISLRSGWNRDIRLAKFACRVCLLDYENEEGLKKHIEFVHLPETRKRVQHLADVGALVETLNIDRMCTECYTMFPSVYNLQVHIVVAHGGKSWLHCGICDQQFCEPNQCLPACLTVGPAVVTTEEENQNQFELPSKSSSFVLSEPPSVEKNPSFVEDMDSVYASYEAKLPTLTICRVLDCHESKHHTALQPQVKFPFFPVDLIHTLLESRGHQGKQICDWLTISADQSPLMDVKPFVFDDPNSKKGGKSKMIFRLNPGEDPLASEGVEMGKRMLESLLVRKNGLLLASSDADDDASDRVVGQRTASEGTQESATSAQASTKATSLSTEKTSALSGYKKALPRKLVKFFTHVGEQNMAAQQERELQEKI